MTAAPSPHFSGIRWLSHRAMAETLGAVCFRVRVTFSPPLSVVSRFTSV